MRVVVIGGGVIGVACSYYLAADSHQVDVDVDLRKSIPRGRSNPLDAFGDLGLAFLRLNSQGDDVRLTRSQRQQPWLAGGDEDWQLNLDRSRRDGGFAGGVVRAVEVDGLTGKQPFDDRDRLSQAAHPNGP